MLDDSFACLAKVSSRGQITIPKHAREAVGLKPGDHVDFLFSKKELSIVPMGTVDESRIAGRAKIMTRGQVNLPKAVCEKLRIRPDTQYAFHVDGDTIRLTKFQDFAQSMMRQMLGF